MKTPTFLIGLMLCSMMLFTNCQKESLVSKENVFDTESIEYHMNESENVITDEYSLVGQDFRKKKPEGKGKPGGGGGEKEEYTWSISLSGPILSGSVDFTDEAPNRKQDGLIIAAYNNSSWTMEGVDDLVLNGANHPPISDTAWENCFPIDPSYTGGLEIRHATGKKKSDKAWILFYFEAGGNNYTLYLYSTFINDENWIPNEMNETVTIITREWRMSGPEPCGFSADYNQPLDGSLLHTMTIERIN